MHIILIGLSHKTAPINVRERLSFTENQIEGALFDLISLPSVTETIILSTCNRTEIYAVTNPPRNGNEEIVKYICESKNVERDKIEKHLYRHDEDGAVRHLFRVTSSLDSMILGEAQILGQVKEAYETAFNSQATGIIFNRLFRHALAVGKRARSDTSIGQSAVSISSAAIELAKKVFGELTGKAVLIVGAGKMSELTAKHLVANGVTNVIVANRTFERAVELADKFGGRAVSFDDFLDQCAVADIVISSTGAPHQIVEREDMVKVMTKRKNRPIFLIDIAVPRDIDPKVNDLYNVFLYDIDDLQIVVDDNLSQRKRESVKVEEIINNEVETFLSWLTTLEVVPVIASLRERTEEIRRIELEKALRKLNGLDEHDRETIKALSSGIVNKILHEPIIRMKECASEKDGYLYIESLRHLFNLNEIKKGENALEEQPQDRQPPQ